MDESKELDRRCSGCAPWHQANYREWVQQGMEALQLLTDHRQAKRTVAPGRAWALLFLLQVGHGFHPFAKFLGYNSPRKLRNIPR